MSLDWRAVINFDRVLGMCIQSMGVFGGLSRMLQHQCDFITTSLPRLGGANLRKSCADDR